MKSKYDIDAVVPTGKVLELLSDARREGSIYVIANIVRVINSRGCTCVRLSGSERIALLRALQQVRQGKKVLAAWLPLGYQTVRFLGLVKQLSGRKIRLTKRDIERIKRAARWYRDHDDRYNRRQLRSLIFCAKELGLHL